MNNHKVISVLFATLVQFYFANAKELTVAYVDWEPFYGENLPNEGPIAEIASEAFARSGYTITTQALPWSRATKKVEDAEIDVLLGVYYTIERSRIYEYSKVIAFVDVGLVSRADLDIKNYQSMLDLRPFSIGISQNWANSPEFDSAYYLKKDPAKNQILTIRKLLHQRVDMIAVSHEVFRHEMSKQGEAIKNFTYIEPKLSRSTLHMASGKKNPKHQEIIKAFNAGFASMKADGTYEEILKRHNLYAASAMSHTSESAE